MRWPFVSRSRYDDARAEADRQRRRADTAAQHEATAVFNRTQVLKQNADADATNRRLHARNLELGRRLSALTESDPEYAASLERRVERLKHVGFRVLAAYHAEKQRADRLQAQWDDLLGLNKPEVAAGETWQERRELKMRWDK